jgi:hypothetical protein
MGVKACDRAECENVMCDVTILNGRQYICRTCYGELHDFIDSWPMPISEAAAREKTEHFMRTRPGTYSESELGDREDVLKFLAK